MKKILIAAGLVALTVPAMAADMAVKAPLAPPVPVWTWTGFYVGGNIGYGWSDRNSTIVAPDAASIAFFGGTLAAGALPSVYNPRPSGVLGGAQAGYNWQVNKVVFGIEGDIQGADVRGSNTILTSGVGGFVPITATATERLDWFATARGRIGLAASSALFYVTGGAAYGQVNHSLFAAAPAIPQSAGGSRTSTDAGYVVGAGVEWAFNKNWSVKGEYLYMDLGNHNTIASGISGTPAGATLVMTSREQYNIVRAGLNYKFGGPVFAKY